MHAISTPLLDAYQALLDLAVTQQRVLAEGQLETFFEIAAERDKVFEGIQLQTEVDGPLEPALRNRVRAVVDQILNIDEDLEQKLRERQTGIREELGRLQPGIQALHAYVQESSTNSFFIDRNQ